MCARSKTFFWFIIFILFCLVPHTHTHFLIPRQKWIKEKIIISIWSTPFIVRWVFVKLCLYIEFIGFEQCKAKISWKIKIQMWFACVCVCVLIGFFFLRKRKFRPSFDQTKTEIVIIIMMIIMMITTTTTKIKWNKIIIKNDENDCTKVNYSHRFFFLFLFLWFLHTYRPSIDRIKMQKKTMITTVNQSIDDDDNPEREREKEQERGKKKKKHHWNDWEVWPFLLLLFAREWASYYANELNFSFRLKMI